MSDANRRNALDYHELGQPGKIAIQPTKPVANQNDLALAYSPGVAHACTAIAEDPAMVSRLTARGNLVAVISNGTAVLGLGNIGPLASKPGDGRQGGPVQALRRHRRLRHRGRRATDVDEFCRSSHRSSRPSAASISKTSRRPSASRSSSA
jgi:hypothetical protein